MTDPSTGKCDKTYSRSQSAGSIRYLKRNGRGCFLSGKTTGKVYPGAALMEAGILLPAAVSEYEAYQIELERV